jgi:hypothetical protein
LLRHLQVPKGVSHDQIRGIFAPYGEIADLNVMPPKKDGAMGEPAAAAAVARACRQLRVTIAGAAAASSSALCFGCSVVMLTAV